MAYINNNGQVRIGVRSGLINTPVVQPAFSASLLQALYGVWNGDTTTNELSTSIFGAWNGETNNNLAVKNAWNANGNTTDSKSGANGTVAIPSGTTFTTGSMTYSTGKLGSGSFTFDGTNFINLPNNTLNFTGDFSISCWFYVPTNYVANGSLVSAFDNKSSYPTYYGWNFSYDSTNKNIGFSVSNPVGQYSNVSLSTPINSIVPGQWNHVVVTRKSSTRSRIYINGVLSASNASTLNPTYNFGLAYIGAIFYGFQQPFYNKPNAGLKIDSIYTFEAELDNDAVSELYNSGNGQEYPFTISNALIPSPNDLVGTNHGTLMNGCLITTGKVGNAFTFDGVNDYVSFPAGSFNSLTTDFSVSAWVYLPSGYNNTNNCPIFSNMSAPSWFQTPGGFWVRFVGTTIQFAIGNKLNPTFLNYDISSDNLLGTWIHVVAVRKNNTSNKIYINNVLKASYTDTNPATLVNPVYYTGVNLTTPTIGNVKMPNNVQDGYYAYSGSKIDSLNVWAKELSQDEITQLYNSGTGAQYPFVGTFSSAGNQLGMDNGTLVNGCYLSTGKIGQAFTFDGVNDYVQLNNNSLNFTGDFSYSLWFNLSTISGYQTLISNYRNSAGNDYGYCINITPSGKLEFWGYAISTTSFAIGSVTTFNTNTWYHVSVTKTSSSVKIYVNGVLDRAYSVGVPMVYFSTMNPSIGALYNWNGSLSTYFVSNGSKIDAINIWKKELTQSEITELYNSGTGKQITATPIVQSGLVLNLDASRSSSYTGTGTTWTDISGSGNNGTMVNGPIFGTANGGCITFDGVNDRITLQNTNISSTGNWTISSWFNLSTLNLDLVNGAAAVLYSQYLPIPGNGRFLLLVRNDGTITNKFQLFLGSGTGYSNQTITGTTTAQINTTYNLVAIRNGSVFSLYLNGNLEASVDLTGTNISLLQSTTEIGGVSNGNFGWVNGKIYNTMVYNRALSSTEITQNFNSTKGRFGL